MNFSGYVFRIDDSKINDYLLNFDHPRGKSKAKWLASKGFIFKSLYDALILHGETSELVRTQDTNFGTFITLDGELLNEDLPVGNFRSVWELDRQLKNCRFVTGYPIQK